jgi:MIP family channel proteins
MAELIGSFMLVLVGCGSIVVDQIYGGMIDHPGISLAFGIVVMTVIYSIGNISGAHINPAVTIGFAVAGRLSVNRIPLYIVAQLIGGILAGLVLLGLFPDVANYGTTQPARGLVQAFLMEFVITFVLMYIILNVSTGHHEKGIMAGVAVGGAVFMLALFGGPVSGASMNPMRTLAPALVSVDFTAIWIYLTAPVAGAIAATPFCKYTQGNECCPPQQTP